PTAPSESPHRGRRAVSFAADRPLAFAAETPEFANPATPQLFVQGHCLRTFPNSRDNNPDRPQRYKRSRAPSRTSDFRQRPNRRSTFPHDREVTGLVPDLDKTAPAVRADYRRSSRAQKQR